jgi:ech hydrogenase subunit F
MQLTFTKTVLGWLMRKPATRLFPKVVREPFPNTRGHIVIDIAKCSSCTLCQRKCPAQAIIVQRAEKTWSIDRYRCIQCNACVETCPQKCLSMDVVAPEPHEKKSIETFMAPKAAQPA